MTPNPQPITDPVPRDAPGAREIGFSIPEQYNASEILFANLQAGRGGKTAVICDDRRVSYAELCELSCRVGNGLMQLGLARGSRVLLVLNDTPEYIAAIVGSIRAGYVPILVNTLSTADLVAYYLEDSGAEVAIVHPELRGLLSHVDVAKTQLREVIVVGDSERSWDSWIGSQSPVLEAADTNRDDMAFWMYSSGSTGRPKGVVHLQHDPAYTHASYGERVLGIRHDDIVFSPPKIFFAYGFGNSITFPFSVGATTVLHPRRPDAEAVFDIIERQRPTIFFGLPTLYNSLIDSQGSQHRNLSSLRLCISAAETLSGELFNEWRRRYGHAIVEGLGSTEMLHIYLSNRVEQQKLGTSGARVPGYEIKIVDMEGRVVPRGESGILCVRGDSQTPCYWGRPDKTAETMRESWIWTGDRFREDEDGFYTFQGRADDLVKVSGQWVHPLEIERCLSEHPLVRECAVLAVEDKNKLTTIAAWVALRESRAGGESVTTELQTFVKKQLLPYKYPRIVMYLDSLPKTGTGKIDRQQLRTML